MSRWFAFRLRTLFVVVLVFAMMCGVAAWAAPWAKVQRKWIAARHELLRSNGIYSHQDGLVCAFSNRPGVALAPLQLRIFGERGVERLYLLDARPPEQSLDRLAAIFPEAKFSWYYPTLHGLEVWAPPH
jgi:hypothetical protein